MASYDHEHLDKSELTVLHSSRDTQPFLHGNVPPSAMTELACPSGFGTRRLVDARSRTFELEGAVHGDDLVREFTWTELRAS